MKKRFAKLIAISSILFLATGCGEQTSSVAENSSVVNPSSDVSTVVPDSSVALPAVTIKAAKDSYTIEKGESTTIRFTVTSAAAKTLTFAVEQDKEIVTIPEDIAAGISVTVTGKAIGKATLVATSTVNPDSVARVSIEVVRPVAPLQSVWSKVAALENYTLNVTRTPTNTELAEHDDWTDETAVPVSRVKTTASTIVAESVTTVNDDLTAEYEPSYKMWGYGLDSKGVAFEMNLDNTGALVAPTVAAKGHTGILTATDFKGLGTNAINANAATGPVGLAGVNPKWLTADKAKGNVYELNGEDDNSSQASDAEDILWRIADVNSYIAGIQSLGNTNYDVSDIANMVNTTITVIDSSTVSIQVETDVTTFTISMTDVGTTADPAAYTALGANVTVGAPGLNSDLVTLVGMIAENDYYWEIPNESAAGYVYNYKNYWMPELNNGKNGLVLVNDELHYLAIDASGDTPTVTIEPAVLATYNPQYATAGIDAELWFAINTNSLAATGFALGDKTIYSFEARENAFISYNKDVSDEVADCFLNQTVDAYAKSAGYTLADYYTSLTPIKSTTQDGEGQNVTEITGFTLGLGGFEIPGETEKGSFTYYTLTHKFGCAKTNPYHEAIEAAIDAKAA